jgi:hypothetical protein
MPEIPALRRLRQDDVNLRPALAVSKQTNEHIMPKSIKITHTIYTQIQEHY